MAYGVAPPRGQRKLVPEMFMAVMKHDVEALQSVISRGADVNYVFQSEPDVVGIFQTTALILSCQKGLLECVKVLIDAGADTEITAKWGQTALIIAVETQWHEIAEFLIEKGARVNAKDEKGKSTLSYAVSNSDEISVKMLLEAGAVVDNRDMHGQTPIHVGASTYGAENCLRLMLENNREKVDLMDNGQRTPLQQAVINGNLEAMCILLDCGACPNVFDHHAYTPLMNCIQMHIQHPECNGYFEKMQLLLQYGSDINLVSPPSGRTVLHMAVGKYMTSGHMIQILMKLGGNANVRDRDGCTPLMLSLMSNNKEATRQLIYANCRMDRRSLDIAILKGMTDMASLLFTAGCDFDREKYRRNFETNPRYMHDHPELLSLLHYNLTTVFSLVEHSRRAIRRAFGQGIAEKISEVGLPKPLINYVLMKHEFEDDADLYMSLS